VSSSRPTPHESRFPPRRNPLLKHALIDEGLATGDANFSERFGREIQARLSRSSLIMVSHSPELVRRMCNRAAILDKGELTQYRNVDEALARYKRL
jgi:capsular polysaccharide transport system ATP-binding protein